MKAARIFSMVALAIPTLVCVAWVIFTLLRGHYLTTLVAVGATVFWFAALMAWFIMPGVVAWGTANSDAGTTIRVDRRIEALLLLAMVTGTVALGLVAGLGATGQLDIPLPPGIGGMYTLAFAGPALVCLFAVVVTLRRPGIGHVRLTPDGFEFAEAFSMKTGMWSEVTDINGNPPEGSLASNPIVIVMANGDTRMIKESGLFTSEGRALLNFVRFYWQHPDHRAELTDGRALERLRTMQLEVRPSASP